jgi:hypothetical protein
MPAILYPPSSIRAFSRAVPFCQYSITPQLHFLAESRPGQAKARKSRLGQTMQKIRNSFAINHQHSTINYFGQAKSCHYFWTVKPSFMSPFTSFENSPQSNPRFSQRLLKVTFHSPATSPSRMVKEWPSSAQSLRVVIRNQSS